MRVPAWVRLVAVSLVAVACSPPAPIEDKPREPPVRALDERAAVEVVQALDVVAPEFRLVVAARGLAELEVGRLGAPLLAALEGFASAGPADRDAVVFAGLDSAEGRAGWSQVCPARFDETFQALAAVAPADKPAVLRGACDPATLRRLGDDGSAKVEPMGLALALVGHGALERLGRVSAAELKVLGVLATAPQAAVVPAPH